MQNPRNQKGIFSAQNRVKSSIFWHSADSVVSAFSTWPPRQVENAESAESKTYFYVNLAEKNTIFGIPRILHFLRFRPGYYVRSKTQNPRNQNVTFPVFPEFHVFDHFRDVGNVGVISPPADGHSRKKIVLEDAFMKDGFSCYDLLTISPTKIMPRRNTRNTSPIPIPLALTLFHTGEVKLTP